MRSAAPLRLATLVLLSTVTAIVSSLGAPLLPEIAEAYGVRLGDAQWTVTAPVLVGAVLTPILGRVASGSLRRPIVVGGLAMVTAGGLVAALPTGFAALVIARGIQGIGLALVPLALATARDVVAPARLPGVLALLSVSNVAGAGLGYPLTALVAERAGIHGAFQLGAALTALALAMAIAFLPEASGRGPDRVDWAGAALLSVGMVGALLSLTRGGAWGWTSLLTLGFGLIGLLLLGCWVGRSLRCRHPLVDLRLAARPGLLGPNAVALAGGLGIYCLLTLVMIVVQSEEPWGLGQPVAVAGLVLVPYSVMSVLGAQLARLVGDRVGRGVLLPIGAGLFLASTLLLALLHGSLWEVLVAMTVGGLGSGFTFSSLPMLMVPHMPAAETASALAFNQVLRYLGFSIGSALSVSLLEVFGGDSDALRDTLLVASCLWPVVILGLLLPALRRSRVSAPSRLPH